MNTLKQNQKHPQIKKFKKKNYLFYFQAKKKAQKNF